MRGVLYCQLDGVVPEVIRLLPLGEVVLADGRPPFSVTPEGLARILAAWRRRGHDLVIDYEHQSLSGQEAPAAGWIKELWAAPDGLYARATWTERAKGYLERREYRYFSPVVQLDEDRQVTELLQVALTNCPAISNLEPLVLQQSYRFTELSPVKGQVFAVEEDGEARMGWKKEADAGGGTMIEKLRTIFGLDEGAEEAAILAAAIDLARRSREKSWEVPEEIVTTLGLDREQAAGEVIPKVAALQAELLALRQEVAVLQAERQEALAEKLIQEALSTKKTTPAELDQGEGRLRRLARTDPEFFRALILTRRENWAVPGPLFGGEPSGVVLNDNELRICELFGLTPEAFWRQKNLLAGRE